MCAWGSLPYAGWGEIIGILCRDVRLSFSHRYDAAGVRRLVEGDLTLDFRHGYVGGTLLIYFEVYIYINTSLALICCQAAYHKPGGYQRITLASG